MQLYCDYHQECHSLFISCMVVKILGLAKCWFWQELSQDVTRISKYFAFNILIDTLTSDSIYRSNLKKTVLDIYCIPVCSPYIQLKIPALSIKEAFGVRHHLLDHFLTWLAMNMTVNKIKILQVRYHFSHVHVTIAKSVVTPSPMLCNLLWHHSNITGPSRTWCQCVEIIFLITIFGAYHVMYEIEWYMNSHDELLVCPLYGYFCVYFPHCFETWGIILD